MWRLGRSVGLNTRTTAILVLIVAIPAHAADIPALLRQMSLEEKLSLVHGATDPRQLGQAGYWPGLPRLGIPPLRFADGPPGVYVNRDATCMPAPVALAATFSAEAARLYGTVLGREARALEQDVLLAPHINIVRDPLFRRNHTSLGEDPLLNARLAAAEVAGIQSQGVMAQIKHLAGYNGLPEVAIDERALHEIYLPAFEAAVQAGAASVMCAYSRLNGAWSCENPDLLNSILRGSWGFRGFVTSDWGATHSPLAVALGLDLEMPGREIAGRPAGPYFTGPLRAAVESGAVPIAAIDQAVSRILNQMDRFHLLARKQGGRPASLRIEADARIARRIAEQGAVLLENEENALPLTPQDLHSLAVIGPTAGQLASGFMGERAYGFESRLVSPLAALRNLAPGARIAYSVGCDLTGSPLPESVRRGELDAPTGGNYSFMVQSQGDGSGAISIDGVRVVRSGGFTFAAGVAPRKWSSLLPTTGGRDNARGTVRLTAGPHRIELSAEGDVRFAWTTPEMRRAAGDAAVAAAKAARTAVVFAWNGGGSALSLPEDQDDLIGRVAAVNTRTVVVLNTGGPAAMPWKDRVRAILETWYPGQEGGWATARLLLGRANPSGKLPVSFPARLEDAPPRTPVYSEGISVGYRWYDARGIEPLFPFGHGLSYTRFVYSGVAVKRAPGGVDVAFTVRNAGPRKGAELAQVYLGPPEGAPVEMAPQSLAAVARLELAPGQSRRVTAHLDIRALSYWSAEKHAWVVAAGGRTLHVGSSSRDIRLRGRLAAAP